MPLYSWPRPCPICDNIGRVYGKKTCGGSDCVKMWRSLTHSTQQSLMNKANMDPLERLQEKALSHYRDDEEPTIDEEPLKDTSNVRTAMAKALAHFTRGGDEPHATNELPESPEAPPAGSRSSQLSNPYTTNEGLPLEPAEEDPIDLKEQPK